jgi:hypothetical protein
LALRAALDEDILAQRYHAGIPPEIPLGGGITLDHDILALPLDHNILMTMTLSELLQLAETVELGEEAVDTLLDEASPRHALALALQSHRSQSMQAPASR